MEALRAAAVADAAEEPLSEARARERAASLQTGVCKGRIDRRVWSASATSRATRLAEAIVVATDAQPLSRLLHHLDNASCRSALEPVKTKPERDSSFLVRRWIARQPLSTPNFSSAMEDRHVDAANRATCRE